MFRWRSVSWLLLNPFVGGCVALLLLVVVGVWCVLHVQEKLQAEQMSRVGFQDEVASLRVTITRLEGERNKLRARVQKADKYIALLRKVTPNVVLSGMSDEEIRACALQVVEIRDLGCDVEGFGTSTSTLIAADGKLVTYSFKVDEQNLDSASKWALRAGRMILKKKQREVAVP